MQRPAGDANSITAPVGAREEPEIEEAFDRLVDEGDARLSRPLLPLLSTGFLGGVDVGVGVLAYLVVRHETGNPLLGSLAFTIGFVVAGMVVVALPDLQPTAIEAGRHYALLGVSWRSFFLAVLAGTVITLLTRMQHATDDLGVTLVPAVLMSFVLVAGQLFHSVLDSILMFAGLASGGAGYNWADWLGALGWSAFGNLVGGLVLVTSVRLLRVPHRVQEERRENLGD